MLGTEPILIAVIIASAVAAIATFFSGGVLQNWIRRVALVILNLSPITVGTWRKEFSKREIFIAAWFLAFIGVLVVYGWVFLERNK